MESCRSNSIVTRSVLVLIFASLMPRETWAAGLNTNVALTPPEDGWIIRTQWRYSRLSGDPTPFDRVIDLSIQPITIVYGLTADLALISTVPIIHREIDFGSGASTSDTGIGDIPLLAKFRFFADDKPGKTTRWAAIGGLEIPTFDDGFSSESYDPIIGTVWTHQERNWWLDWDLLYKFNTAGGIAGDDELRGDVAYSHLLMGGENESSGPWGLYAIGEINALYITDGSVEVLGSPGLQYITPNLILEAGVQLPLIQDMESSRLETDYTIVLSVRFQF